MTPGSLSPTPSAASTIVSSTTTTRKKRTIVVVRRPRNPNDNDDSRLRPILSKQHNGDDGDDGDDNDDSVPASPNKKTVFVARRPRPSEGKLFEHPASSSHGSLTLPGRGHHHHRLEGGGGGGSDGVLSTVPRGKLEWHPDGRVLEKSVLGTAAAFEEVCRTADTAVSYRHISQFVVSLVF